MSEKKIALFPGSFDPFTKGHEDIVLRGLRLFDEIIVSIGYNQAKSSRYFPIDKMVDCIQTTFRDHPAIRVVTYAELTAGFARKHGARYLLRGIRNTTDFEYEN
ncbi:MAG: adenylyltransferase/cytidyltransferase family protein, partial [Bacteroidota bacterium]|nr:adenylyltransferase/cytidyltransferase family protein [Bacteroidota bacterium]